MNKRRTPLACAAVLALVSLNGCVAAAIPALAGAAMVRSEASADDSHGAPSEAPTSTGTEAKAQAAPSTQSLARPERSLATTIAFFGPAPAPVSANSVSMSGLHDGYVALFDYVESEALGTNQEGRLTSAVLANPSALDGKRADCRARTPTVLIDLDHHAEPSAQPDGGTLSPDLGERLAKLRENDVAIAWISERSAAQAGEIRRELKRMQIDPEAKDQLILMRYPGDRKQTRRADLAKASCIVAIAGDNREDFDELYEYLVRPDSALALELLIGKGWFLVPPVLGEGG